MTIARRTSVVVPAFNEERAVGPIVSSLQSAAESLEILAFQPIEALQRAGDSKMTSVQLIVLSVVIFLIGLVSEQISSLRFESRRP